MNNEIDIIINKINSLLLKNSLPAEQRCILVGCILLSLTINNESGVNEIIANCNKILDEKIICEYKRNIVLKEVIKINKINNNSNLIADLFIILNENLMLFKGRDVIGLIYNKFMRTISSDQKVGLVLTPTHITELFCDLVDLNKNDVVFDPCCGTGGFLISSLHHTNNCVGFELRNDMFALATIQMLLLHNDSIYHGSCFDENLKDIIKKEKPTVSFLNPPYQSGNTEEQLEFIENSLECLVKGGRCVAICQMSTALNTKGLKVKERMLKKHTLKAVLSMPNDLFHPVGVVTVILIFEAHKPHDSSIKSFFGYFKDDGFEKRKNKGRVDVKNQWQDIKQKWLNTYRNKESIAGLSVTKEVTYKDEWVAEAYMETDYSKLTEEDFIKTIKEYVAFDFLYGKDK